MLTVQGIYFERLSLKPCSPFTCQVKAISFGMHICDFTKEMSHKGGSAVVVTSAVLWVDRNLVGVTFAVLRVDGNSGLLCCSVLLSLYAHSGLCLFFIHYSCTGHLTLEWTWMTSVLILWDLTQHISHISNLAIFEINFMAMFSFIGLFNAMLMLDYWYRFCFYFQRAGRPDFFSDGSK